MGMPFHPGMLAKVYVVATAPPSHWTRELGQGALGTYEHEPPVSNTSKAAFFPQRVYAVVERIPYGRVTTYGLIARALGAPRGARMVGWALRHVDPADDLPCHRVVNRIGVLSGGWHFGHPDVMRDRLLAESVPFRDELQVDIAMCLWDPSDDPGVDDLWRLAQP